jgi:hypothetical protein
MDFALSGLIKAISKLSVEPPIGTSDHNTVVFNVNSTRSVSECSNCTQTAYAKADYT